MSETKMIYDVIVIGAGSAGLPAALYSTRYNLKTLVIGELMGGALTQSHLVENYPGFSSISGTDLMDKFKEQAELFGAEIIQGSVSNIIKIEGKLANETLFSIETNGNEYLSKTVIFAGGNKYKRLNHPKEISLIGKGISYCATCDGMFFKNREVSIVGGGNTALTEALYLSHICKKVNIIHRRDTFRAEGVLIDKIKKVENIELQLNEEVKDFELDNLGYVNKVILSSGKIIDSEGVFIAIGNEPDTKALNNLNIEKDEEGYLIVNSKQAIITEPGLFAAGDITTNSNKFKQTIMSAAEGALAANSAHEYLS